MTADSLTKQASKKTRPQSVPDRSVGGRSAIVQPASTSENESMSACATIELTASVFSGCSAKRVATTAAAQ